jgi:DNA-binding XRE family transcriptional regulator
LSKPTRSKGLKSPPDRCGQRIAGETTATEKIWLRSEENFGAAEENHRVICGNQIKAARALAGINQDELAKAAGIGVATLVNLQNVNRRPKLTPDRRPKIGRRNKAIRLTAPPYAGNGIFAAGDRRAEIAPETHISL